MSRWGYAVAILKNHPYIAKTHYAHPRCAPWVTDLTDFDDVQIVTGSHRGYLHSLKYYCNCDVCLLPVYWPIGDLEPEHIPEDLAQPPRHRPSAEPAA